GNLACKESCMPANIKGVAVEIIREGKNISLQSRRHQIASRVWCLLLPMRRYLLFIMKQKQRFMSKLS
ncbi:hypothetical protein LJC72_12095, partial [Bacteroides sp. OttesenSCG-928-D19]|nr:hypothetical protein [Bacteroides sp. OttesenSCG-928-D19]